MSCSVDDTTEHTLQRAMIAGDNFKKWNIAREIPANDNVDCRPEAAHIADNAWIFYRNGDFKFDSGESNGNVICADFIDFTGSWYITEGKNLKIVASKATYEAEIIFNDEIILFGTIDDLTEDRIELSRNGHTVIFHPSTAGL